MRSGEYTGRSVDEAVFHGLQELGLSIDEVNIETLQSESKGLFGIGAKLARVRLTERSSMGMEQGFGAAPVDEDMAMYEQAQRTYNEMPQRDDRWRDDRRRDGRRRDDRRRRPPQREEAQHSSPPQYPQYPYSEELAANHPAAIFLSELIAKMGVSAKVLLCETEDGVRMRVDSDTRGLLIGRRGETLDALQYLTSLHVNRARKQEKYLRVTIDTEDYRSKREDTLIRLAKRQAYRVKSTGRPIAMEPMNPYERRVLHASLQNHPYVMTHSEGDEPNRRVVITPRR